MAEDAQAARTDGEEPLEGCRLVEEMRAVLQRMASLVAMGELPARSWRQVQETVVAVLVDESSQLAKLSSREQEVWRRRCEGHTSREIGRQLMLSEHTVNTHVQKIHAKLEVGDFWEVALWRGHQEE